MSDAPASNTWFTYFPEDYRWSAALCGMLSGARFGATEIGELDQVGRRLSKKLGDDNHWFREWVRMADHVRGLGLAAERKKQSLSACSHYLRACNYYQMAERFRTPKDKLAIDAFKKGVNCFHRFTRLTDRPKIEIVEVSFEGRKKLPGYFVHAQNTKKAKPPVVVFFDGLDVTKELQYMRGVEDITRRGMSVLIMDGPGTGEAIRMRKIYLRHDYEAAGSAALDYLETRKDVNAKKVGVMAISLGGYYAPRMASMDRRFKACLAWGAIWDYHATWKKRIDQAFKTELSVPGHHIQWILNAKTMDDALAKLDGFRLDGVVQKMRCPFLLVHGEGDKQIPMKDARALYNAVGSKDKTMKVFTVKEGGSQHCQRDNLSIGTAYMFDWLKEKLGA
ncbi:MAG: alpha/beta hydrolase [Nitrospinaceae bacterium]|jgi:dienelactone hydrolase|nr:alpha/beta hydrolase [Nitrospinaceae bacterium]MBT3435940.1 alpha/beta hydrolase [Nitrospinaceae bacterium]MBT4094760.1 alpha/beta hydrolase [Nitrospinaceae bacterium]MBT5369128.1 alpha/beta hydrolase [Nitrospinaceae bacterium]MBT5947378.1 alpha/beta hydrolase [Nitrospinaceae bacterium]